MSYLQTSQAFLEQASLLFEAYPDSTRITTRYSYPSPSPASSKQQQQQQQATLTLKTYNPAAGICLKYRTNKAAEVGRLIAGLGKLASGVKISADLGAQTATTMTTAAGPEGDTEMMDVSSGVTVSQQQDGSVVAVASGRTDPGADGRGSKPKKKGGKGGKK